MGLSNEKPANTAVTDSYIEELAQRQAHRLVSQLIKYEHNPDPREAPNPAEGVRIRVIRPERSRVSVDEQCKKHNDAVQSLGRIGEFSR